MGKRSIFILLGLLAANGALADAYTWIDENGIVHYSDRPQPGATKVILSTGGKSRAPAPARYRSTAQRQAEAEESEPSKPFSYESLEINNPGAEETLWNIEGTLSVSLSLTPALRPGDQVRVYFDGTPQIVSGTTFQLQEVYRGVHNIQVEVVDETGKLMIRSRPSRFYVQQNNVF